MAKTILIKNRAERIMLLDFILYYKATVINIVMYHSTGTKPDNRIESPEIKSCTYSQLIYDKGGKKLQWREDSLFNKWCWENQTATCTRMKLEHPITPYTKINSK